jgi:TRAP-type mannitol/chloroaromatic compound transport system permease small subunit
MQALLRFAHAVDTINEWLGRGLAWLGLVAVLVCTANAIARYVFNTGSNAWLELQWYLNSAVFLFAAAYALRRKMHVRIDVLFNRLSPRAQTWIEIFGHLFFLLPAVTIIAWYSWPSLVNSIHVNEYSSDPGGLIRWPVRLLIPTAFAMLGLQGISQVIKSAHFLMGGPAEDTGEAADVV